MQDIFKGKSRDEYKKIVRAIINERYFGVEINNVKINADSSREFTMSNSTKSLYKKVDTDTKRDKRISRYEAKMRLSTELDNLIKSGGILTA